MKITKVEVGWGFTKNIGGYESNKSYVAYTCSVGQDETHEEVTDKLEALAKAEVRRMIKGEIRHKKQDDLEDYY